MRMRMRMGFNSINGTGVTDTLSRLPVNHLANGTAKAGVLGIKSRTIGSTTTRAAADELPVGRYRFLPVHVRPLHAHVAPTELFTNFNIAKSN
mmetsp:Transcript_2257/g.3041  ORF Transcript_2257/g.3041 Transcript_2257/m.3041 type:complete len:93 (-) Transcript_2257:791-1069(-)